MAPREDKNKASKLPASGLSKRTMERLKIEFRFLIAINDLLQ